jgi:hypothetical protein
LLTPTIATSGALMTGVEAMPPSLPRLVTGDRRAHELVARRLVRARGLGHAADLCREVVERARLGVLHHGHLEAVRSLGRDADVHRGMAQDQVPLSVVQRVALREGLQHPHERGDKERQIGER